MAGQVRSLTGRDRLIPAFRYHWLTPLYDTFQRWFMPEVAVRKHLVEQTRIHNGHRVLDLGAGTGTLTILMGQAYPQAHIVGLDGDPRILRRARAKAEAAGVDIQWDEAFAYALPYPDNTFDRVVSSLMFHHLTLEDKVNALWEVWRVLRPGGELYILDFGKPHTLAARLISLLVRQMEETADEIDGLLPDLLRQAGFRDAQEMNQRMTIFGTLSVYKGLKPDKRGRPIADDHPLNPSLSIGGERIWYHDHH
jgi:ubiquinone/menaquinone biosynthesis C-methylase UbiE